MDNEFGLIVLGAGPGGYVAAIRAAQLGIKTAIIEEDAFGGTCLNRGCIPTKAFLHAAQVMKQVKEAVQYGIKTSVTEVDMDQLYEYKNGVVDKLRTGVEQLLAANKVTCIRGKGKITGNNTITVLEPEGNTSVYIGNNILVATGSKPMIPKIKGIENENVLTSDDLLSSQSKEFTSITIIGGGVIGVEFGYLYNSLGWDVTIIEAMESLLPMMDRDISQNLSMILKKKGIKVITGARVEEIKVEETKHEEAKHEETKVEETKVEETRHVETKHEETKHEETIEQNKINKNDTVSVLYSRKNETNQVNSQAVLVAIGRKANLENVFDSSFVPEIENGRIKTDDLFQTSIPNVYAIGDVTSKVQLAHVASAQGIFVAERIAGKKSHIDLSVIPSCIYCEPEIGSVGITVEDAKASKIPVNIGKYITSSMGKSLITKEERGFVKLIVHAETKVLLGAQLMCAHATDMVGELATAIANEMTIFQLTKAMKAHPTFNEAIGEALEDLMDGAIHAAPKRKN